MCMCMRVSIYVYVCVNAFVACVYERLYILVSHKHAYIVCMHAVQCIFTHIYILWLFACFLFAEYKLIQSNEQGIAEKVP